MAGGVVGTGLALKQQSSDLYQGLSKEQQQRDTTNNQIKQAGKAAIASGVVGGALSGAALGASEGSVGGPWGALIGAAVGGLVGWLSK